MAASPVEWDAQGKPIQPSSSGATEWDANGKPIASTSASGPQGDTRSLFQKAKDNFNANTRGAQPGDNAVTGFIHNVSAGGGDVVRGIGHAIMHPEDTANGVIDAAKAEAAKPVSEQLGNMVKSGEILGPGGTQVVGAIKGLVTQPGRTLGQLGTGAILGEAAGTAGRAISEAPRAAVQSGARAIAGDKLDVPITGDSVTRELYDTAKKMGVNLDTAQATGSGISQGAKRVSEHSLGGSSTFEANKQANIQALHTNAEKILDSASPEVMSRENFGNAVKQGLLEHQQELNDDAGSIYKRLDQQVGATKPDATGIQTVAKSIVDQNKDYFDAHPDILSGGDKKAWAIVQDLAKSADVKPAKSSFLDAPGSEFAAPREAKVPYQDSWSDMHKLRSDLLDITRSKDLVGTRATGWIKQLTGAVDQAMTDPKGMDPAAAADFRTANNIYSLMKATYDDPRSRLYHVVRAADGLTAANTLANITPQVARQVVQAAPELAPQLQRQTISRILSPAGNDVPDLQNLPSRFSRVQKEQLQGVLTPDQIGQLEDLGRVSRAVNYDSNTSGTAKVGQKVVEAGAIGGGLMRAGVGLMSGDPVAVAEGAAPLAYAGAQRGIAKVITNPKFTEAVMNATKGQEGWANRGAAKVTEHIGLDSSSGLTPADITVLRSTPAGKKLLMRASAMTPGSSMMKSLILQISKNLGK